MLGDAAGDATATSAIGKIGSVPLGDAAGDATATSATGRDNPTASDALSSLSESTTSITPVTASCVSESISVDATERISFPSSDEPTLIPNAQRPMSIGDARSSQ